MKILRSIHTVNPALGGPIESIRQSSLLLQQLGHEVEIVTLDLPDAPWVNSMPVPVHALGEPRSRGYGYSAHFVPWLRARRAAFDIVIVQGIWQYSSFGVWRALAGTDTPYVVFPHGMLDPWFKRTYPLKHLKKWLYWPWAEYRVLRDAAAVCFTSEEERRAARESFALYRCNEAVVNYGTAAPETNLDEAREAFLKKWPQLREKRLLLFLSRLTVKKGCDILIEAFAQAHRKGLHLVIAGPASDPAYQAELEKRARAAFPSDEVPITFTGMLQGDLKWGAFAAAEAFVLPSHQENFGMAVAEALATRLPVLISERVNIWREIVADGAGYAENDDVPGTQRLIERWVQTPPAARAEMRMKAGECFARRFEIHRAVESLLDILQSHVARG